MCSLPATATNLTGLLSVGATGDVEKDFEDLYDPLRGLQRDGRGSRSKCTLKRLLPLDLKAALHGRRQNRHACLLVKFRRREGGWGATTDVKFAQVKKKATALNSLLHVKRCLIFEVTCLSCTLSSGRSAVMRNMRRSS